MGEVIVYPQMAIEGGGFAVHDRRESEWVKNGVA